MSQIEQKDQWQMQVDNLEGELQAFTTSLGPISFETAAKIGRQS